MDNCRAGMFGWLTAALLWSTLNFEPGIERYLTLEQKMGFSKSVNGCAAVVDAEF